MTHKVVRWCTAVFIAFAFAVGGAPAGVSAQSQGLGLAQSEASALKALSDPSSPVFRKIIYFDIDSFEIREEFRGLMRSHANLLKANRQLLVSIRGHTDEGASREYNLALGQKRAEAVRKAFTSLGVPEAQLEAVSFGEEKPMTPRADAAAQSQNRLVELEYRGFSPPEVAAAPTVSHASAQSSLPKCASDVEARRDNHCFAALTFPDGGTYVGEWRYGERNGNGTDTCPDGRKYVGEFKSNYRHGEGIEYRSDGSVSRSGRWGTHNLVQPYALDTARFPFNPSSQVAAAPAVDPARAERERLAAEAEAERKKRIEAEARQAAELEAERRRRQELEQRLLAEAKERERVLAEAKEREKVATPQRPQAALKPERRVALVIGNAACKVSPLGNPVNDATDMAESLRAFGFQTTLLRNATLAQMRDATRRFAEQLPSADVALIFFAGHGIESKPKNYMIPVNAELKFEYELSDQAYDAGVWLDMLESIKSTNAERVNIVILDACRDNNLIGGKRNLGRGLGRMDAPSGTFLAYSTAPGKIAADGGRNERNSPFTKYLLRAMQQPNLPIEEVFKEVRRNVGKDTKGEQVPWESTSLTGFFAFRR